MVCLPDWAQYQTGIFIINSIAAVIFTAAWYGIVRYLNLRNIEYFSLLIWFLIHPLGLGHYQSIPESVDPTAHAMLALITLMFFTRSKLLLPTLFIALMVKESFIFISIIIIASELCHAKATNGTDRYSSIYLITGIISVLITYKLAAHLSEMYWFAPTNGHAPSSLDTVRHFWREVRREPARLIVWLTAIICVVGAFPILLIKRKRIPNSPLNKRVSVYFLLGSSGFIALGLLGGSDMSRIIFTGNLLVLGFMMWPADGHLPTPWHTLLALILGSLIALSYTHLLPASLEYDYYMQGQRLRPTLTVLTVGCITLLVGWGLSRNGLVRKTDGILVNLPAETRQ